jgi:hypothetical protein
MQLRIILKFCQPYMCYSTLFCKHTRKYNVLVRLMKNRNVYVCLAMLSLRVVEYKHHGAIKVLIATKRNLAHKCHPYFLPFLSDFSSSADFLI